MISLFLVFLLNFYCAAFLPDNPFWIVNAICAGVVLVMFVIGLG